MMYNKIRLVRAAHSVTFSFLDAAGTDSYILKSAGGLGPPEVTNSITRVISVGTIYTGRQPQPRAPVITLKPNPNYSGNQTAQDLRTALYWMYNCDAGQPGLLMQLMLDDAVVCQVTAYPKTFEFDPFAKDTTIQIAFDSSDIYWRAPAELVVPITLSGTSFSVNNPGGADVGFKFSFKLDSDVNPAVDPYGEFNLMNSDGEYFDFVFTDAKANTEIDINSIPGQKGMVYYLSGSDNPHSLLEGVGSFSTWLKLKPGNNIFTFRSVPAHSIEVRFTPQWWGV